MRERNTQRKKERSRTKEAFLRHKLGRVGLWILVVLYAGAIFAQFISPYAYN